MRVITGSARGRRLITLEGMDVRPTADRVKEGMFNAVQFEIEGRTVLDLLPVPVSLPWRRSAAARRAPCWWMLPSAPSPLRSGT